MVGNFQGRKISCIAWSEVRISWKLSHTAWHNHLCMGGAVLQLVHTHSWLHVIEWEALATQGGYIETLWSTHVDLTKPSAKM